MSSANTARHNAGFQYRLRFFHKCRSPGGCDPGQLDRFQIQCSALESTCGAPIIVVLVRYRHDPESGLSRECHRAQFAPGAACFAVKAIVVPADQVLSYMDQPLLQQPRLMDSQGRNLLGGPDVSPDGCIYATPLEKNGIAHLNNFCLMQPYTGQEENAAASGSGMGLGLQKQHSGGGGSDSHGPKATRRVRAMLGNDGGTLGCGSDLGGLGVGSEVIQDSGDVLSASSELCLLVQLLRRDMQRPGRWFAYDMPHLISRPFQVVPRSALLAMQQSPESCSSQLLQRQQIQALVAQGRGLSTPRHSAGTGLVRTLGGCDPMPVHPHPFMSPQYKRHQSAGSAPGAVPTAGLAAYGTGPGLPSCMGVVGAPQQLQLQDFGAPGFVFGSTEHVGGTAIGIGAGMGMGVGMGMGMGAAPGVLPVDCPVGVGPVAFGGAAAGGAGFGAAERGGGGGQQSSMSTDSRSAGAGSQRAPRARRRSCLSKDSSHDDSSVGGGTMAASGGGNPVAGLRTPSITSGMNPSNSGLLRGGSGAATSLAAAAMAVTTTGRAGAGPGTAAPCPAPSPPISPPPRVVHAVGLGAGQPLPAVAGLLDVAGAAALLRSSDEGRPLPPALRHAPSATLLDMNISDLLNDIQPQPLLAEDMMELGEGAPKRVRSNLTTSDVAAFMSDNNAGSQPLAAAGSPRCAVSLQHQQMESSLCRGGAGDSAHAPVEIRSGGGGYGQQREGHLQPSRADSWSAEMSPEQLLNFRKHSTGFSGTHAASFAPDNSSNPSAAAAAAAVAAAASDGGGGGSRGSSASQLDLLVQLLGQPGAMQDALDRMEQEHQRLQG